MLIGVEEWSRVKGWWGEEEGGEKMDDEEIAVMYYCGSRRMGVVCRLDGERLDIVMGGSLFVDVEFSFSSSMGLYRCVS